MLRLHKYLNETSRGVSMCMKWACATCQQLAGMLIRTSQEVVLADIQVACFDQVIL